MNTLQAMATFVAIVEQGSLTAAAASLTKSLRSVVRVLASLEQDLGVRLLNRTTRRIGLTEEGSRYLERCRQILDDVAETERLMSAQQSEPSGLLKVTAPVLFGQMHVTPSICGFVERYPRINIDLQLLDRTVDLIDEGVDVGIRIAHLQDSSMVGVPVGQIHRVVCASPKLLNKTKIPRRPEALAGFDCIKFTGLGAGSSWSFKQDGRDLSVPIKGPLRINHAAAAIDACVAGLGFGAFLSYQVEPSIKSGKLKRVLSDFELPPIPVNVLFPHGRLISTRMRVFVNWITRDLRTAFHYGGAATDSP